MTPEADLLPLSGLQHLAFCERQCALIHLEGQWAENVFTAEGKLLHERVDSGEDETRGDVRIARGVPVRSLRLGITGKLDVLELRRSSAAREVEATRFPGFDGLWQPVPVEYKRGKPKFIDCDRVQLCAQAICLEEMLGVRIAQGIVFYGQPRRRFDVELDHEIRERTEQCAARFHEIMMSGRTPIVHRQRKCRSCSLLDICKPPSRRVSRSAADYLRSAIWSDEAAPS